MSSATGALKKQSEIGDNEEQQSAARRLPDDKLSRARPLPRAFLSPFFPRASLGSGDHRRVTFRLYRFLIVSGREIARARSVISQETLSDPRKLDGIALRAAN